MRPTRRELLGLIGGGAVGAALSPLPWKLLDDAAIWTQNWSLTPALPRGPLTAARGHCSLCPAACGVEIRCVGGEPFAVRPVAGHPTSAGALCPLGLAGHQLRHHPERLVQALLSDRGRAPTPISPAELAGLLSRELGSALRTGGPGSVAVLDARPGRSGSLSFRSWLAALGPEARYLTDEGERGPFTRFGRAVGLGDPDLDRALAPDLGRARTIVGFGADLLDGWGSAGWAARFLRTPVAVRPNLVQIDSRPSRTALLADRWLRVRPGTEGAAALGIGAAILEAAPPALPDGRDPAARAEALGAARAFRSLTVERAAEIAGVAPADLRSVARLMLERGPAVTVPGVDPVAGPLPASAELAILGLGALAGNLGVAGGLIVRRAAPLPEDLAGPELPPASAVESVEDGSLRLLVADLSAGSGTRALATALPKLHPAEGRVVLLGPFAPARLPDRCLAVPTPAWLEALEDVEIPADATAARLALAARAGKPRHQALAPADLVLALAHPKESGHSAGTPGGSAFAALLAARARAILAAGRGAVHDPAGGAPRPIRELGGPDELVAALEAGAIWIDEEAPAGEPLEARLSAEAAAILERAGSPRAAGVCAMPHGSRTASDRFALPPHLAKLCRENGVLPDVDTATVHPATARRLGLGPGRTARLELPGGARQVRVAVDARLEEDAVDLAVAPAAGAFGDVPREPEGPPFPARVVAAGMEVA